MGWLVNRVSFLVEFEAYKKGFTKNIRGKKSEKQNCEARDSIKFHINKKTKDIVSLTLLQLKSMPIHLSLPS